MLPHEHRVRTRNMALALLITVAAVTRSDAQKQLPAGNAIGTSSRPNIVLIVIDAFRADRVQATNNGSPVMPTLSRFAEDSWNFVDAMSPEAWTKPAMASIYTSLFADAHGIQSGAKYLLEPKEAPETTDALPAAIPNIATILKTAGYDTTAIQTNPNLQDRLGFANGFNRYVMQKGAPGVIITPMVLDELRKSKPPFFLYVHYFDPHAPYLALPPYNKAFGEVPPLPPQEASFLDLYQVDFCRDFERFCLGLTDKPKFPPLSEQGRAYLRHCYDVECRLVDDQLRQIFEALAPITENTLIVLTADHGEELWDRGELGHGKTAYDEVLHVPLMFHHPTRLPKKTDHTPVGTVDIVPTIAAFLGLPADPRWQGVNLLNAENGSRPQFSQCKGSFPGFPRDFGVAKLGPDKLVVDRKKNVELLFDVVQDPGETRNLAAERPEKVAELRNLLAEHCARMKEVYGTLPHEQGALDEETRQAIKALGYLAK